MIQGRLRRGDDFHRPLFFHDLRTCAFLSNHFEVGLAIVLIEEIELRE
jgi:hypothetical protein